MRTHRFKVAVPQGHLVFRFTQVSVLKPTLCSCIIKRLCCRPKCRVTLGILQIPGGAGLGTTWTSPPRILPYPSSLSRTSWTRTSKLLGSGVHTDTNSPCCHSPSCGMRAPTLSHVRAHWRLHQGRLWMAAAWADDARCPPPMGGSVSPRESGAIAVAALERSLLPLPQCTGRRRRRRLHRGPLRRPRRLTRPGLSEEAKQPRKPRRRGG